MTEIHKKPHTVLFYGQSGAGKGTQARLLEAYFKGIESEMREVLYVQTGALIRGFAAKSGYTNTLVREAIESGRLLPSFVPTYLWTEMIAKMLITGNEHIIFDGIARRELEAELLNNALAFYGRNEYDVVILEISDAVARERLTHRGRSDDISLESVNKRLDWYKENTQKAIDFFETHGARMHHINGEQSPEEIHTHVLASLGHLPL